MGALLPDLRGLDLPHLVIGNLLKDLQGGGIDAAYHAEQLARAADRLDG